MRWFDTAHCRSRAHCQACRHDRAFRESIHRAGMADGAEFECRWGMNPPPPSQCGTRLAKLLERLGFRPCGRCMSMEQRMNAWGPEGCREHMAEIVASMQASASNSQANPMRIPFIGLIARRMILHCCRVGGLKALSLPKSK